MSEEILINVTPQETRVAMVENGVLTEVSIERRDRTALVGNIFMGKVLRVLPGMEAAFIDIGLERAAFLHVSDVAGSSVMDENGERHQKPIREVLREGQQIAVQVIKNPLGNKGARLSSNLTAPSRYLVYMPDETTAGVSTKIDDDAERERLRDIIRRVQGHRKPQPRKQSASEPSAPLPGDQNGDQSAEMSVAEPTETPDQQISEQPDDHHSDTDGEPARPEAIKKGGYIVRTAAEGVSEDAILRDVDFLHKVWRKISAELPRAEPGKLVYSELPLLLRTLRDLVGLSVERIRIDSRESFTRASEFASEFLPEVLPRIEHYPGERPIFDIYGVEDEIQKALERKVQLKSGGHLVFDQTESMTTIDVNTGAFVGHRNLEETIFKTNLEAAQAIGRQLRLRNLGGIIIIDFIDMSVDEHKRQVMRALEKTLDRDHARTQVCEVSSLGLVEMTRKRTRESLEQVLCSECPACNGRGLLRTAETVCYDISREIIRQVRQFDVKSLTVVASPDVVEMFLDEQSDNFAELESFIEVPIRLQAESMYNRDQYDVVIL